MAAREVLFEHVALNECVKCSAVDPQTATEVSVIGPACANPRDLERLALAKLLKRLKALPS
jgi:hypothetical protein